LVAYSLVLILTGDLRKREREGREEKVAILIYRRAADSYEQVLCGTTTYGVDTQMSFYIVKGVIA